MEFKYNSKTGKYDAVYQCKICKKQKHIKSSDKKTLLIHKHTCPGCHCKMVRSKPVTFKNLITGQVVRAKSISDFCRPRNNLGPNAKFHFTQIINGEKLHYKGWGLNKNYKIDQDKIVIVTTRHIKRALYGQK